MRRFLLAVVAAVPLLAPAVPAFAHDGLRCGAVLTASVQLTRDLRCHGTALTVAAAGVVVDLAGHRVSGDGSGAGVTASGPVRIVLENGTVQGFEDGIRADAGITMNFLRVVRNDTGAHSNGFLDVADSTLARNRLGLVATSGGVNIVRSVVRANTVGISVLDASALIADNRIAENITGIDCNICFGSSFLRNRIQGNSGVGLDLGFRGLEGSSVQDNAFVGNGIGVSASGGLHGGTISRDVFKGNALTGLLLWESRSPAPLGGEVVIDGNVATGNGYAAGSSVDTAGQSLGDGIHLQLAGSGYSVHVGDNIANGNANYGIEAYGVTDDGGNRARGDGDALECLGVSCG